MLTDASEHAQPVRRKVAELMRTTALENARAPTDPKRKGPLPSLPSAFDEARTLNIWQVAELYGVSVVTARRMQWRGLLPAAVRIGSRLGWRAKDILATLSELPAA
jgi:predicted DNA-binding transcriptional regulator AlpA